MSLTYSMANYVLKEDFEKFLEKLSVNHLQKLNLQRAVTWQKRYIELELTKRANISQNLNGQLYIGADNTSASDQLSNIIATQTWY